MTTIDAWTGTKGEALEAVGLGSAGFGKPSKMPGRAWGISADECATGTKLAKMGNTTCSHCYAQGANYQYPSVRTAHRRRLDAWRTDRRKWRSAMTYLLRRESKREGWEHFRWFDSGDLQGRDMLEDVAAVSAACPELRFWMPTHEIGLVRSWLDGAKVPSNLTIRLSAVFMDAPGPERVGLPTSTVHTSPSGLVKIVDRSTTGVQACPAPEQNNECGDCRACWDPSVPAVSYRKH